MRLMGVPEHFLIPEAVSDSNFGGMLGNAMSTHMISSLLRQLFYAAPRARPSMQCKHRVQKR